MIDNRKNKYSRVAVGNTRKEIKAEQHHAEGLDINNMIAKYTAKGYKQEQLNKMLSSLAEINATNSIKKAQRGSIENNDLAEQAHLASKIRKMFESNVPGLIKKQFNYDPFRFYQYVKDPANKEAVEKMFTDTRNYTFTRYED